MSMREVIESIEREAYDMVTAKPPAGLKPQALIRRDAETGQDWVICPFCHKRQFPITLGAKIVGQKFKCKGSKCHKIFEVNV